MEKCEYILGKRNALKDESEKEKKDLEAKINEVTHVDGEEERARNAEQTIDTSESGCKCSFRGPLDGTAAVSLAEEINLKISRRYLSTLLLNEISKAKINAVMEQDGAG